MRTSWERKKEDAQDSWRRRKIVKKRDRVCFALGLTVKRR